MKRNNGHHAAMKTSAHSTHGKEPIVSRSRSSSRSQTSYRHSGASTKSALNSLTKQNINVSVESRKRSPVEGQRNKAIQAIVSPPIRSKAVGAERSEFIEAMIGYLRNQNTKSTLRMLDAAKVLLLKSLATDPKAAELLATSRDDTDLMKYLLKRIEDSGLDVSPFAWRKVRNAIIEECGKKSTWSNRLVTNQKTGMIEFSEDVSDAESPGDENNAHTGQMKSQTNVSSNHPEKEDSSPKEELVSKEVKSPPQTLPSEMNSLPTETTSRGSVSSISSENLHKPREVALDSRPSKSSLHSSVSVRSLESGRSDRSNLSLVERLSLIKQKAYRVGSSSLGITDSEQDFCVIWDDEVEEEDRDQNTYSQLIREINQAFVESSDIVELIESLEAEEEINERPSLSSFSELEKADEDDIESDFENSEDIFKREFNMEEADTLPGISLSDRTGGIITSIDVKYDEEGTELQRMAFDSKGRVIIKVERLSDDRGFISFQYDGEGNLVKRIDYFCSGKISKITEYGKDLQQLKVVEITEKDHIKKASVPRQFSSTDQLAKNETPSEEEDEGISKLHKLVMDMVDYERFQRDREANEAMLLAKRRATFAALRRQKALQSEFESETSMSTHSFESDDWHPFKVDADSVSRETLASDIPSATEMRDKALRERRGTKVKANMRDQGLTNPLETTKQSQERISAKKPSSIFTRDVRARVIDMGKSQREAISKITIEQAGLQEHKDLSSTTQNTSSESVTQRELSIQERGESMSGSQDVELKKSDSEQTSSHSQKGLHGKRWRETIERTLHSQSLLNSQSQVKLSDTPFVTGASGVTSTKRKQHPKMILPTDREAVKCYMASHGIYDLFQFMIAKLVAQRPDQPIDFLISMTRQIKSNMKIRRAVQASMSLSKKTVLMPVSSKPSM